MALPKNGDWSTLVQESENPNGMIAQTANGTEHDGVGSDGSQFRYNMADGSRWNSDPMRQPDPLTPVDDTVPGPPMIVGKGHVSVAGYTRRRPG